MSGLAEKVYEASPVFIQNALVSAYGYKLYRKRYTGAIFQKVRQDIKRVNAMSAAEQRGFQAEKLHEMIKHCRINVPYYSALLADFGFTEQNFTDINHLSQLPILDKDPIRKTPELFRAKGATPYMVQHTSGSTGTPLSLWVNEYTYKLAMALLIDHEERHGVLFGAKRATFAGRMIKPIEDMKPPFSRFNRAENQRLFSAYHINRDTFPNYFKELERFRPKEIIGYPSAIYDLSLQYLGADRQPTFKPNAIITNSETLLEWQRETIESVFQCEIFDYYGTAEYVTFAGQCSAKNYHYHPIIGITEVSPYNTSSGRSEAIGEIITTSLTNLSMPILRYRVGDTATLTTSCCKCGSFSQVSNRIEGRTDDFIVTPDNRKIGRIDHIFKGLKGIKEAQLTQESTKHCTLHIVKADPKLNIDEGTLKKRFAQRTSNDITLRFNYISHIKKSANGKFKSVVGLKKP